jgi:peptide/nickel transport system substrate-binding protein
MTLRAALLAASLLATPILAKAQEAIRIGVEAGPTSLDPHFASLITNIAFSRHVFQPLMEQDHRQELRPAVATAFRVRAIETAGLGDDASTRPRPFPRRRSR